MIGIYKVNKSIVSKLPEGAILHGISDRSVNEVWTIDENVLCFQSSPEINKVYI
jgi:hypothetical protein